MQLLMCPLESKADYIFIKLCMWYEEESGLETINSDEVLRARLSCLPRILSVKMVCQKTSLLGKCDTGGRNEG